MSVRSEYLENGFTQILSNHTTLLRTSPGKDKIKINKQGKFQFTSLVQSRL